MRGIGVAVITSTSGSAGGSGLALVGLLHQAEALHHAEAMLLVDDHQPKLVELDRLLDERVRADHQLCVALRDVVARLLLAARFLRAGQQHDAIARALQDAPRRQVMLRCKNLRGRHQRDLVAVLDGDDRSLEGDDGFAGADIALQQATHGRGFHHVIGNFFQHALLRRRGMKRQNAFQRCANSVGDGEGDAGLRAHFRRFNSSPSSRKNSSSKIRRMCAGVRAACKRTRLSPTSGQCACDKRHAAIDHPHAWKSPRRRSG